MVIELDKKTLDFLTEKYRITYSQFFKLSDGSNYYVLMFEDKKYDGDVKKCDLEKI